MKISLIAAALTLFCFIKVPAQIENKMESKRLMALFNKLEGTYQVQVLNSRDKTEIPLYIMDSIEIKRKVNEVVYFPLKNNVRVMVLPYNVINKKGFTPIARVANISTEK